MAVAVATKDSFGTWNPSMAAERIPPWFPTRPPSAPETAPAMYAVFRPKRILAENPVRPETPAKTSSAPSIADRTGLLAKLCSSAPISPPTALVTPKLHKTPRSTYRRRRQKRTAIPIRCGTDTAATAVFVSTRSAMSGVRMLPIPNPATAAIALATTEAIAMMTANPTATASAPYPTQLQCRRHHASAEDGARYHPEFR